MESRCSYTKAGGEKKKLNGLLWQPSQRRLYKRGVPYHTWKRKKKTPTRFIILYRVVICKQAWKYATCMTGGLKTIRFPERIQFCVVVVSSPQQTHIKYDFVCATSLGAVSQGLCCIVPAPFHYVFPVPCVLLPEPFRAVAALPLVIFNRMRCFIQGRVGGEEYIYPVSLIRICTGIPWCFHHARLSMCLSL